MWKIKSSFLKELFPSGRLKMEKRTRNIEWEKIVSFSVFNPLWSFSRFFFLNKKHQLNRKLKQKLKWVILNGSILNGVDFELSRLFTVPPIFFCYFTSNLGTYCEIIVLPCLDWHCSKIRKKVPFSWITQFFSICRF